MVWGRAATRRFRTIDLTFARPRQRSPSGKNSDGEVICAALQHGLVLEHHLVAMTTLFRAGSQGAGCTCQPMHNQPHHPLSGQTLSSDGEVHCARFSLGNHQHKKPHLHLMHKEPHHEAERGALQDFQRSSCQLRSVGQVRRSYCFGAVPVKSRQSGRRNGYARVQNAKGPDSHRSHRDCRRCVGWMFLK